MLGSVSQVSCSSGCELVAVLFQTLLNELQSPTVDDDDFIDVIMSCCHVLVTSPTFGLSFTTKFDHMVCLAGSISI